MRGLGVAGVVWRFAAALLAMAGAANLALKFRPQPARTSSKLPFEASVLASEGLLWMVTGRRRGRWPGREQR
jgi:hypothetical protein